MSRIVNNFKRKEARKELRKNQTPQEIILWSRLRDNQTSQKWKRQVSIGPYIADFYCSKKLLVIEIDGSQHLDNKKYDKDREEYFLNLGIKTIRFWNSEINTNIDSVLKIILEKLELQPHPSLLLKGEGANSFPLSLQERVRVRLILLHRFISPHNLSFDFGSVAAVFEIRKFFQAVHDTRIAFLRRERF